MDILNDTKMHGLYGFWCPGSVVRQIVSAAGALSCHLCSVGRQTLLDKCLLLAVPGMYDFNWRC